MMDVRYSDNRDDRTVQGKGVNIKPIAAPFTEQGNLL
jgi:hypothetical protein